MNLQATTTKTVLDVIVQQNPDAYSDNRINSFLLKSFLEGLACCFSEELFQKFPVDYDQFMQNYANIWDLMQADHRAFWESQKFIPIPPYILDRFDQMFRDRDYGNLSHYLEGVLDVELLMRDAGECIILFLLSLLMRCVQPMTRVSLKLDNLHLSKRFDTACGYIGCCHKVEERRNTKKRGKKKGDGQQKCQKHVCVIGRRQEAMDSLGRVHGQYAEASFGNGTGAIRSQPPRTPTPSDGVVSAEGDKNSQSATAHDASGIGNSQDGVGIDEVDFSLREEEKKFFLRIVSDFALDLLRAISNAISSRLISFGRSDSDSDIDD